MKIYKLTNNENLIDSLKAGEVGLLPTDTIYGLSCSAYDQKSVERIYEIKGKNKNVPVIVLISGVADLQKFRIHLKQNETQLLASNWPGRISFILSMTGSFEYLVRGRKNLAFRVPDNRELLSLLQETGPLVSTSANPCGLKPAENLDEAEKYFGDKLDFYVDAGELVGEPSTLVDLTGNRPVILRQGAVPFRN